MIATALIIGASLLAGGLLVVFWNNIISFLKKAVVAVAEKIQRAVLGTRVCVRKTGDLVERIHKFYSQDTQTNQWKETRVIRTIEEKEVPANIRERMVMSEEFDITDELENKLIG